MKRHFLELVLVAIAALVHSAGAQSATLRHAIPGIEGAQSESQLGYSVATDGAFTAAGAPYDDSFGGYDSGVVKVFNSTTGALLHVIPNPSPAFYDNFGNSVAISGSRLVVGASGDDTGAGNAGVAYVFDLASGTPTVPVVTLNNPAPASLDFFGHAVAISGTRVVVGAYRDDAGANDAGSVYVYDIGTATPTVPVATLSNPTPAAFDIFGNSVAISGTRVVVGAPQDDTGASDAGSAYLYDLASGTPTVPVLTISNPTPASSEAFGRAVAISGTRVVIGAPQDNGGGNLNGAAYVYDVGSGTPTVPVATLNNPTPALLDGFGSAVAIFGTRIVVGAPQDDAGATDTGSAYVYDLTSGTPNAPVVTMNNPGPGQFDNFGQSVAISSSRVAIGVPTDDLGAKDAGTVYLYDPSGGSPNVPASTLNNPGPSIQNTFGVSVAISGSRMVVGASGDDTGASNGGRAFVYNLASGAPLVPEVILENPTPDASDQFGYAVAISGNRVVVGALGDRTGAFEAGSAYVYDLAGGNPATPVLVLNNPTPALSDYFGISVAIAGTTVVVGASGDDTGVSNAGSAYVYDLTSETPSVPVTTLNNPAPADFDSFGGSVAVAGTRIVVGAPYDDTGASDAGSAYVYDLASATPTVPVVTLNNPVPEFAAYGSAVAVDGARVVIGAPYANNPMGTGPGITYVYDVAGGTPTTAIATLKNPGPGAADYFGVSVAISGTQVLVGASYSGSVGLSPGYAYLYNLASATPTTPVTTLSNPAPAADDQFGLAVGIAGTVAVIGAPGDESPLLDKGSVYVFDLPDTAGPTGGTFTITPASPVAPATALTGTFSGWSDLSLPLTYEIREGASVLVGADANAAPTFNRPAGSHSITARIYDSKGNFTEVGPVTVVVDGTAPVITTPGNLVVSATSPAGAVVNFAVSATDNLDQNPLLTVAPLSGTIFPIGVTTVTVTAKDAVNNQSSATFTVTVAVNSPLAAEIATTGAPVPGAGSDARIAAGATWTAFATPAINDAGEVAYLGKWKAPAIAGGAPAQVGTGIFVGETLLAKVGQTLPQAGTLGLPDNAVFKSFRDPVIDAAGHVSFLATVAGTGISGANDGVVMSNVQSGVLKVLAREGGDAPETGGAKFKSFADVSALGSANGGVLFTAALKSGGGNPRVTGGSDTGAWWLPAGGTEVLSVTREGNPGFNGGETIKSVTVLSALSGSPGHGRGLTAGDRAIVRLTLGGAVPRQNIVRAEPGVIIEFAGTGTAIGGNVLPQATWKGMNLPAAGSGGQNLAVLGTLAPNAGGVGSVDGKGIFVSSNGGADWEPLARMTNVAVGFSTDGASYVALSDPVISSTEASVAFMGTVKGGSVRNSDNAVIWWRRQGAEVAILAREGVEPPGAPAGAKWDTFTSLAFPGGGTGPLFTAMLKRGAANGKITAKDDMGLYAADGNGTIREVMREGQPLANLTGRTVKSFNVLKAVAGTAGVKRAFNDNGQVAALVTFSDNTSGIVKIELP